LSNISVIIGAAAGGFVLFLLLLLALVGLYAFHQKKRAEKATEQSNPFGMGRFTAYLPLSLSLILEVSFSQCLLLFMEMQ